MPQMKRIEIIKNLRLAIELAGDGGMQPFTDEEYQDMFQLLDELSTNDKETTCTNNGTIVVVSEDDFDDFFADDYEDYKKIMGKCFINEEIGIAVKILVIPDDEYNPIEPYEFIYERFEEQFDGWASEDYNWLQNQTREKYEKLKITPFANMNIASEDMFHLGKNGKLYTSVECGDDYYEFTEITVDEFEKIKNEAIENNDQ
jgi:hypothetical protein